MAAADTSLDESLNALDSHSSVEYRLSVLRQFAELWHGPIRPGDGYAEDELQGRPIPHPLRRWFRLAGHRRGVFSGQNALLAPEELTVDSDGRVIFYVENQGVYVWSTMLEGDDPPVLGRFDDPETPWTEEGVTLSEFLIGACLFQATMSARFGAAASWADQTTLDQVATHLTPLPLVPWRWPASPARFYARKGAFMFACPNNGNQGNEAVSIWIGSKTAEPLAFLKTIVDKRWEYVAIE
jgi:hypothetical protein